MTRRGTVLVSGRKETMQGGRALRTSIHNTHNAGGRQVFEGRCRVDIPGVDVPAQRPTHKHIHFYLSTGLYGAWMKGYKGSNKTRIFIGSYQTEEEALRAQDRACLKFKLPAEMLHYPEGDYVEDEELRKSLNHEEFAELLRGESRSCYKTMAPSKCLKKLHEIMQRSGGPHSIDQPHGTDTHDIYAPAAASVDQLPTATGFNAADQQHYLQLDHLLQKVSIPRRKRTGMNIDVQTQEKVVQNTGRITPKAAVASLIATKPQDTKSCSANMELVEGSKSESLDLASKMNSLCIPTRARSISEVRSCAGLKVNIMHYIRACKAHV